MLTRLAHTSGEKVDWKGPLIGGKSTGLFADFFADLKRCDLCYFIGIRIK